MRLYGINPVLERIRTNPESIKKLYLQKRTDLSGIVRELKKIGLGFDSLDKQEFLLKCKDIHAQGVIAEVDDFLYVPFSKILNECVENVSIPIFLDGVTDPQNLGAIIRNVACLGGFSLVLPRYDSAQVNETVLRVANGGENYLSISQISNTATTLKKVKEKGVQIAGAVLEDSEDILAAEFTFPLAVVVGSEGKGIRPGVCKYLDLRLRLPMNGASLSYNVAVASSLFCYEVNRRRF